MPSESLNAFFTHLKNHSQNIEELRFRTLTGTKKINLFLFITANLDLTDVLVDQVS
ncbi:hypothetical protein Mic7113_3470 [Allocoleopsis franciscana PCC 7113]|uniref:Uncharacterized protein n=1 Tax=Allocoleopsis franciscana PCC 7113 TaxID=1173027 RepID=K9WHF1_9CYAN|nr:hypothetical protein Mic7113_3470 [Allocoleopsis franciscana PCC 7113]